MGSVTTSRPGSANGRIAADHKTRRNDNPQKTNAQRQSQSRIPVTAMLSSCRVHYGLLQKIPWPGSRRSLGPWSLCNAMRHHANGCYRKWRNGRPSHLPNHLSRHDANLHSHGWPAPWPPIRSSSPGTALSANTRTGAHGRRSDATHVTQCYANRKNRSFVTDAAPLLGRDPLPFFLARTASARPPQYVRLFFAIRAGPAPTIAAPLPSAGSPLAAKVNPMISKAKWFRPLQFGSSVKRAHDAQFRTISHKHAQPAPPRLPHRAARKIPRCRPYLNTITAKLIEYA